ncbi:hypothetical protein L1D50_23125, partial [Pseudoalteromonas sp. Isolate6]|uniref:hypothetical protein n=1 Tax=Pseudoalteromonas sp. Isolate6 TaxID=2908527 RepID=UPI001EFCCDBC
DDAGKESQLPVHSELGQDLENDTEGGAVVSVPPYLGDQRKLEEELQRAHSLPQAVPGDADEEVHGVHMALQ